MTDEPDDNLFAELDAEDEARSTAGLMKRLAAIFQDVAESMDDSHDAHFRGMEIYRDVETVVEYLEDKPRVVTLTGLNLIASAIRMRGIMNRFEREPG